MSKETATPRDRIIAVVARIPRGRVATYGQVAEEAGLPRRARLVGNVLGTMPDDIEVPWHRVVNARGEISRRSIDLDSEHEQRRRLTGEGIEISTTGRIRLEDVRWDPAVESPSL